MCDCGGLIHWMVIWRTAAVPLLMVDEVHIMVCGYFILLFVH